MLSRTCMFINRITTGKDSAAYFQLRNETSLQVEVEQIRASPVSGRHERVLSPAEKGLWSYVGYCGSLRESSEEPQDWRPYKHLSRALPPSKLSLNAYTSHMHSTRPTAASHHRVPDLLHCFALIFKYLCPAKARREALLLLSIPKLLRNPSMFAPEVIFLNLQFPRISERHWIFRKKEERNLFTKLA